MLNCQKPQTAYVFEYPKAVELAETQNDIFWSANEIKVEKDIQDMLVNMTPAEKHGVVTVLKLFTLYELFAGNEYWGNRVMKMFPKPCINMMANSFSFFELNVHAPFYNKINEALHLNTEDFYNSYVEDETLKARMDFIEDIISSKNDLLSLGVFSMVEGAVLYSSFAFLKHFQSNGKNKILNIVRGINFSVRDENLHSVGGAYLFNLLKTEMLESNPDAIENVKKTESVIVESAKQLCEHEFKIVDMIFEEGKIDGITDIQLKHFVESRINLCLKQLGIDPIYEVNYNPIKDWFYDGINSYQMNDFFSGIGNGYNRNWDEKGFTWNNGERNDN